MRRLRSVPLLVLAGALLASSARADSGEAALRTRLLNDLSSEAASVREQAAERLSSMEELPADELSAAVRSASVRARPHLFRLAAERKLTALIPDLTAAAAGTDAQASESAIRALVALGPDAVTAGTAALEAAQEDVLPARERTGRLRHLAALDVQRRVEHEVVTRWRRKGGSYRGRYVDLRAFGWDAQPVLLAMLLDVPLEDQFVVVPPTGDEDVDRLRRSNALHDLATSRRRGYRTFDPLPPTIDPDADMFDLAQQALADVADLDLMRKVLEDTHQDLMSADRSAGWRPRRFEKLFAQDIEIILASRGAPERLEERRAQVEGECRMLRRLVERRDPEDAAEPMQALATSISELAGVLHQLQKYEEAARRYDEVIGIVRKLTSQEPAVGGYNRACALARLGQRDKALAQLARALDPEISSGTEDLTREWVMEDGDLLVLHSDPRFEAIVKRRFGP